MKQYKSGYIIIGAGHAGIAAVEGFRQIDPKSRLYIIDPDPDAFYFRAATKFMIKGHITAESLQGRPPNFYKQHKVTSISSKVIRIDRQEKIVFLANDKQIPYVKICIATGGSPFIPPIEGKDATNIYVHRSLEDTKRILNFVEKNPKGKAIIIGAGVLGTELAEALNLRQIQVKLFTREKVLIPRMLDQTASHLLESQLILHGVEVSYNVQKLQIITDEFSRAISIRVNEHENFECDAIFICTGIRRNIDLAKAASLEVNKGVLVNNSLQTSDPNIYAAGDIVEFREPNQTQPSFLELWGPAGEMGKLAGKNMTGLSDTFQLGAFHAYTLLFGQNCHCIGNFNPNLPDKYTILESKYTWNQQEKYLKLVFQENILVGVLTFGEAREAMLFEHIIRKHRTLPSQYQKEDLLDRTFDLERILYAWSTAE